MKKRCMIMLLVLSGFSAAISQMVVDPQLPDHLLSNQWDARWIQVPDADPYGYGVYLFRNQLDLNEVPDELIIHLSADNRYKLHVNGKWVGLGPARSDEDHWIYETYNLAPWLKPGNNTIAITVWNFGQYKPWAQHSLFTALIVQGNDEQAALLNTPGTWRCIRDSSIEPVADDTREMGQFIIVGPRDHVLAEKYPWGWRSDGFDDTGWLKPATRVRGAPRGVGTDIQHALVPRRIPAMELTPMPSPLIRTVISGLAKINPPIEENDVQPEKGTFINIEIPPNSSTTLLLDQRELVNAYPQLDVSGGEGSRIKVRYAEALFNERGEKAHRDSIAGMTSRGYYDEFIPDGKRRVFETLWFRTYRYVTLEITTNEDPLVLHEFSTIFTGYPFQEKASFKSSDPRLNEIWEAGWRTSRLCANELFYDCPYYEQMQYVGDTRIQALISLYVSGDDRLMKKAIRDFYHSMTPEGLTRSRYPSEPRQNIPTYSLFWISMIHDFMQHRTDYNFTAEYLASIQHILRWFEIRIDPETGMVGPIEYWPFVDWTAEWPWDNVANIGGVPPGGLEGNSSIITLQYAITLQQAADIFSFYGLDALSKGYLQLAGKLIEATTKHCWDEEKQYFSDTPEKSSYSQHANTFAVLSGAVEEDEQALLMDRVIRDRELIQASFYFRYYVHRAMIQAGLGNKYLEMMGPWKEMLDYGLTTFTEITDLQRTRSDCHAWSSSPLYEFLATVAGIYPAETGFRFVFVEPHPGNLDWIKASMPHQNGAITTSLSFNGDKVKGSVTLPPGTRGLFVWKGRTMDLQNGENEISMKGSL